MKTMQYKNYIGSVNFDEEALVFYGKIENICGLVTFEANKEKELCSACHKAVDDYLDACVELNIKPEQFSSKQSCI